VYGEFIGANNDWGAPNGGGEAVDNSLRPYLSAIRARWWLLAATALAAVAGCAGLLSLREPEYEARARIVASPIPPYDEALADVGLLTSTGDPTRDGQTFAAVLETDRASAATGERLGLSRAEVASSVSIEPVGESNVLGVTATAETAGSAQRLANEYARATLALQAEHARGLLRAAIDETIERRRSERYESSGWTDLSRRINRLDAAYDRGADPTLRLLEPATTASSSTGLGRAPIMAVALVAGLGFGALLALVLESFSPRVRDADDVARVAHLPVLARVPRLGRRLRPGARSLERLRLRERDALDALRAQVERRLDGGGTVLVVSAAAKDGRSTAVTGLALALTEAGHSVATIDATAEADPADAIAHASDRADFVVVDTAPLSESSDALALTHVVDATILVARVGHTRLSALRPLCALLERSGEALLGTVVMGQGGSPQLPPAARTPLDVAAR
jgi:capsular polysaccharide biosynthesis protein